MSRLVIFGAGGFGREVASMVMRTGREIVFAADAPAPPIWDIPVLRPHEIPRGAEMCIAIGDGAVRRRVAERFTDQIYPVIVAPTAIIGHDVSVGEGSIFCDFATVTASTTIGRHFHCNLYSCVAHDCIIGDFVTFGGQVACLGNVVVENGATIYTGAMLRNGDRLNPLIVGSGAIVAMGSVVTKSVESGKFAAGYPARSISG